MEKANYEAGCTPIFAAILVEGRSMVKEKAVFQKFLVPVPDDWNPVQLYVLRELVVKDLRFGWGNENTYKGAAVGYLHFLWS